MPPRLPAARAAERHPLGRLHRIHPDLARATRNRPTIARRDQPRTARAADEERL